MLNNGTGRAVKLTQLQDVQKEESSFEHQFDIQPYLAGTFMERPKTRLGRTQDTFRMSKRKKCRKRIIE
jgi:hypothetical protein